MTIKLHSTKSQLPISEFQTIPDKEFYETVQKKSSLVEGFCASLNDSGIRYCHWKSNARLDRSLTGENDLDLLVHRQDSQQFAELLFRMGFKHTIDPSAPAIPGIDNYYGYDEKNGRFIHVHVHYQLVVGHDATKNYRIPVEEAYLDSVRFDGVFKVPSPEFEFILLVIRMGLKHLTWDAFLRREAYLSTNEIDEYQYLRKRVNLQVVETILGEHFAFLSPGVFKRCMKIFEKRKFSIRDFSAGKILVQNLNHLTRLPVIENLKKKMTYRLLGSLKHVMGINSPKKVFSNGGLLISIVGGDGSGKTTLIDGLYGWLEDEFNVEKVHFGKPPWSISTWLIRSSIKVFRTVTRQPFLEVPIEYSMDPKEIQFPGTMWAIREVCTAHDRLRLYRKVRRQSTNGKIILMDRYLIKGLQFMDSPQIRRLYNKEKIPPFLNWLMRKEESYYQYISPPDLMIVIKLDPEISVIRKVEEEENSVRARAAEIWNYPWDPDHVIIIDGTLSREEVLRQAKIRIWGSL